MKQVIASISSEEVIMLIATASGWTVGDIRPLTRLNVTAIAEEGGKREIGSYRGGRRVTYLDRKTNPNVRLAGGDENLLTARNLAWLAVALALAKVLHELGHALSCKYFGGDCHELGVMLLLFTPCLYCNVTDAWLIPEKWRLLLGLDSIASDRPGDSTSRSLYVAPNWLSRNVQFICNFIYGFSAAIAWAVIPDVPLPIRDIGIP